VVFVLWEFFTLWAGVKGRENLINELKVELESFFKDLDDTAQILKKYSDENKQESRLTLEVKVSLKQCYVWLDLLEKKQMPEDLLENLRRNAKSLKTAISLETLAQTIRIQQHAEILARLTRLDLKKPWEYYQDGKYLIGQKRWLDAKTNLINYRNYVLAGKVGVGDEGVKKPSEDSHLKYLAYIQDELNAQGKVDPDPILSVTTVHHNQYWPLWHKWEREYMGKK